jgi:hypothetical protein
MVIFEAIIVFKLNSVFSEAIGEFNLIIGSTSFQQIEKLRVSLL